MCTFKVFNLRQGEGRFLWLTVEATTVRKALLKASKQLGHSVDGAELETVSVNGNYLAKLGDLAIRLSARRVVNDFYVE